MTVHADPSVTSSDMCPLNDGHVSVAWQDLQTAHTEIQLVDEVLLSPVEHSTGCKACEFHRYSRFWGCFIFLFFL